jgi:SAM-dependent methyltransferase
MAELLLLRYESEEAERSPELRYLASSCLAAARRVFGPVVEIRWRPGAGEPALAGEGPLLVFGEASVHLGAASLERMKAATDAGAAVVVPQRLDSFPLATDEPVHTLRAFERLEGRILGGELESSARRTSHLPVALFSPAFFAAELRRRSPATLLTDHRLLDDLGAGDPVHAGVFYRFIDYYGEVRDDILPFLPPDARDVLDVGCGRGMTGALLEERLGCRVTGVELNPEVAADAARRLSRVIVGDVEQLEIAERFDAVVATELFEHLSYPETFLARMKELVRPGGRIVLSVPNIGHYSVVEDLLAGRWDYVPMGLLCYTHFRFFTRATLESWIERAGFTTYEIVAQQGELPERFAGLGDGLEIDRESLRTTGFYVVLNVP